MAMLRRLNSRLQDIKETPVHVSHQQYERNSQWTQVKVSSLRVNKRAHHASVVVAGKMYVHGGYQASGVGMLADFIVFDLQRKQWKEVGDSKGSQVGQRHSHTMVYWNDKLYIFGGIISTLQSTNKVFSFSLSHSQWKQQTCSGQVPPCLNSHKALLYKDHMIIVGGEEEDKYSQVMYSLNLKTMEWKVVCKPEIFGFGPRSDFSLSLYLNKALIFGGKKDDHKFNDLWQLDLQALTMKQLKPQIYLKPSARSGHSSCIYKDQLLVFGGTTGITHERNDLLVYNIGKNYWVREWQDEQQEMSDQRGEEIVGKSLKKSRSNSFKKMVCSQFSPNSPQQNCSKVQSPSSLTNSSPKKKYRQQMKHRNYYNENYPFYGDRQGLLASKHKKNDLLVDLQKETRQDMKHHGLAAKNGHKIDIHLSQTFESLNNSILTTLVQNAGRLDTMYNGVNSVTSEEKPVRGGQKQPKPRDGHSCQIYNSQMIIFGGDRHHMSFNDVIMVDLERVLGGETRSRGNVEE